MYQSDAIIAATMVLVRYTKTEKLQVNICISYSKVKVGGNVVIG